MGVPEYLPNYYYPRYRRKESDLKKTTIGKLLATLLLMGPLTLLAGKSKSVGAFAVYYGFEAGAAEFTPFDLVVLESENRELVPALKRAGKTVLAYLSVGEVNASREYFLELKRKGLLLEENPNWPDAYLLDIRNPAWKKLVLEKLIPAFLADGFDGVFLDTVDSPLEKERVSPKGFAGMGEAALDIIRGMRKSFPEMKIMLNRGYGVAEAAAPEIDYILGESILGSYDFQNKRYLLASEAAYEYECGLLDKIRKENRSLQVMTLDYCEEKDMKRREEIYRRQSGRGFVPYATTIGLDKITPPPPGWKN